MNCTDHNTDEYLPEIFTCQLMDLDEYRTCSENDSSVCIICSIIGKFFAGDSIQDVGSVGHILCVILWSFTVLIGLLGVFTNFLVIIVIRRMKSNRPFDILIMFLGAFDMVCCGASLIQSTMNVALYQTWVSRDFAAMQWFHKSTLLTLFGRSASTFMAILITMERFLVITFPLQTKQWFTSKKTTLLAIGVILISLLLNIPRLIMFNVELKPQKYANITALEDFTYIIGVTHMFGWNTLCLFYEKFGDVNEHLDFLAPLPILLIFNILSYAKVRKIQNRRKQLDMKQKAEIEAVKLFMPVVIAYFSTCIVPFIHFSMAYFTEILYRELHIAAGLSVVINSAVNFCIYYYQRPAFKKEADALLREWYSFIFGTQGETRWYQPNSSMADDTVTGSSRMRL
ncbi:unnamed protein product [Orchesella dallaii]|uniref:G-protein coupled receptors family 1 profile domain-containing protein n=1 Tax=Orchesella dallaii TaxID=48710 RepID=A0ABP1RQY0_9HEXA